MAKTYKDQADNRLYETFRDQHGRFWGANIEISTGDPCDVLKPQFLAPIQPEWAKGIFTPPEDVVGMVPRAQRARLGYSVAIDYVKWLEKHEARQLDYDKKIADFARGMNKEMTSAEVGALIANPTQDLLRHVGRPPFPPREFILAMAANNKWALGQFNGVPPKAVTLLESLRPILAAAKARGAADLGLDPFEDEDGGQRENDDDEIATPKFVDPLGNLDDVASGGAGDLEEQFDGSALGNQSGRPIPVAPKGGKKDSKPKAGAGAK